MQLPCLLLGQLIADAGQDLTRDLVVVLLPSEPGVGTYERAERGADVRARWRQKSAPAARSL